MIDYGMGYLATSLAATSNIYAINEARFGLANAASTRLTFGQVAALGAMDKSYSLGLAQSAMQREYSLAALNAFQRMQKDTFERRQREIDAGVLFG
ncbi:MAG: hypothetical protein VKJ04_11705 [Vampirovibrionales bacterium]|nr:hypothetical protein [Vampirovibrionales bacterium]